MEVCLRAQGVVAQVAGHTVAVGNSGLLRELGLSLDERQAALEATWQGKGAPRPPHSCHPLALEAPRALPLPVTSRVATGGASPRQLV